MSTGFPHGAFPLSTEVGEPHARATVPHDMTQATRLLTGEPLGTYTRTAALDRLVDAFLSEGADSSPRQIVSLGAGTDTRPFRIFAGPVGRELIYHEVDFGVVCRKKLHMVQTNKRLASILPDAAPTAEDGTSWRSSTPAGGGSEYRCHGMDLRGLVDDDDKPAGGEASPAPRLPGLRTDVPTLVLSECCLCYMSPREAQGVLSYFSSRVGSLSTVIYEPIRPDDAFGRVMVSNLAARRIRMPTLDAYREPADQERRLREAGFGSVRGMTVGDIWRHWVSPGERERVDALEGLDEVEEWELLADHYIVAWGARGDGFASWDHLPGKSS